MSSVIDQLGLSGDSVSKASLTAALAKLGVVDKSPLFAPVRDMLSTMPDPVTEADLQTLKERNVFVCGALDHGTLFGHMRTSVRAAPLTRRCRTRVWRLAQVYRHSRPSLRHCGRW